MHHQSIVHSINESTRSPGKQPDIIVTSVTRIVSTEAARSECPLDLRRARFRIAAAPINAARLSRITRTGVLHQQIAQPSFVRKRLHESAVLHLLQDLGRDAAAHIHTADRQDLQRQVTCLRAIGGDTDVQRFAQSSLGPSRPARRSRHSDLPSRIRSFSQAGSSMPLHVAQKGVEFVRPMPGDHALKAHPAIQLFLAGNAAARSRLRCARAKSQWPPSEAMGT